MSSSIWTAAALASSAAPLHGRLWRVVEAQAKISTMKLTDTLEEQAALERLLDETKPKIPMECGHLGYLLFTPFRYAPYPFDSRFRRAGSRDGVFYASEEPDTAIAEASFYRLLFFAESPNTPWPSNPMEHTVFAVEVATARAVDLTRAPLVRDRAAWSHVSDYAPCLALADAAREAAMDAIRYESVRDPEARANVALLTCRVFTRNDAVERQTWHLHVGRAGVRAVCEAPGRSLAFGLAAFANDRRLEPLRGAG
jgi:hypothetical protein